MKSSPISHAQYDVSLDLNAMPDGNIKLSERYFLCNNSV